MQAEIKGQLRELAEEEYRVFASGLLPNISNILGVRLPLLRKMAKEITKADWREYLKTAREDFFEEIMLQGMVIGCAKCSPEERLSTIREFVPKINNWSVCDSFCSGLNFTKENMELVWEFLQPYARSEEEFEIRFAVVMLLFYYSDKEHIEAVLEILDGIRHEGYYVKMAVAWAVSICYIKLPEQTMPYLQNNHLDDFTYNKSLQKITESYRVDQETKKQIRLMKRK
ncbi:MULTISPECIES: DNA alkylation repair protein [Desulfitobacterium]|uniref:Putative DNA alkylation repair enzyme n=1 Tax=Desulfitobacterium dehalogenans (strain ATCC 51507 / DSM 9161 / JW/IU-DC1) TaxID=756499 RepID=I4A869_DESDJ|nr:MULTISPECIES: DNA alkylation repair protein [Desulfitobacterium]AFM00154.1 putative DNA alkylation repair enzyme [Desulfitobacterium dehalogenans ATCC 51507]